MTNLKNIIVLTGILVLTPLAALAETMKVEAMSEFSTSNPTQTMQVKLTEDILFEDIELKSGDMITGEVVDIISPKRLKRNAKFSFIPEYYTDSNGLTHNFKGKYKGKYSLPIDKKGIAKNSTLAVGSYFVKGLSLGVNAVQGAIQNEEGNRLKSAGKNVYDNSPLSYVETGNELEIHKGDKFYIKFGRDAEEDETETNDETVDEPLEQNE